jgi:molybdopterin-containing oxidoreductase family membrane subunit
MRKILGLRKHITDDHFESIAKILLFTSLLVTYSYIVEFALALYSGNVYEKGTFFYRMTGDYRYLYWGMLFCNSLLPLTLFVRKLRRSIPFLFGLSILVNIGMWLERFVIIVSSLSRDFDPYAWGLYKPRLIEAGITLASFGFFFTAFLIFTKLLPVVAITELKEVADE